MAKIPSTVSRLAKRILPNPAVRAVSEWRRNRGFDRSFRELQKRIEARQEVDSELLDRLIWGWSNTWSANNEYLKACLDEAWHTSGDILECGSGLTTLVVGAVADLGGRRLYALEHEPIWAERVNSHIRRFGLKNVSILEVPLTQRDTYDWYDVGERFASCNIGFVVCDGPPGTTRGGRYGLLPELYDRFSSGCVILLDDAEREPEQEAVSRWLNAWDLDHELLGEIRRRARLVKRPPVAL